MNTRVWDQVGLELVEINVQRTIKTKRGSNGGDNWSMLIQIWYFQAVSRHTLSNQAVQVDVVGALKTKVSSADVIDSLVVDHERTVGVLESGMGGQDGVIWLNDGGCGLRSWVNAELQLDLLAEVDGESLHE